MSLYQRMGEIFLASASQEEREEFSNHLQRRFLVRDGGMDNHEPRVILLLESPHKDEIRHPEVDDRFPLAGRAGRHVMERFTEWKPTLALSEQPIGQLVHNECDRLHWLGIMNVSQIPLQREAYLSISNRGEQDLGVPSAWKICWKCMKCIRARPSVGEYHGIKCKCCDRGGSLRDEMQALRTAIEEDLKGRLEHLQCRVPNALLVCCGDVAQAFYKRTGINWQETCNFPHPMRRAKEGRGPKRGWHLAEPAEVNKLKETLEDL